VEENNNKMGMKIIMSEPFNNQIMDGLEVTNIQEAVNYRNPSQRLQVPQLLVHQ
jgi:hypothetical protein